MSNELKVLFTAMVPIFELRGAIPLGLFVFKLGYFKTIILSIIGNLLPILPLIYFLKYGQKYLSANFSFFKRFFDWWFKRTEKAFSGEYAKWGKVGLAIFVAIPLPMTGAWTGALASTLFGMKPREGFLWVSLGVLGACIIVSILCTLGFLIN